MKEQSFYIAENNQSIWLRAHDKEVGYSVKAFFEIYGLRQTIHWIIVN